MSTLKSPATICLPAHILDANISPRAREVLMLLASQTTIEHPAVWVCHAAIAEKLRCSPITVKRAIQKLIEANLIVETGDLHERRYKFYRVRWSLKAVAQAKARVRAGMIKQEKVVTQAQARVQRTEGEDWIPAPSQDAPCAGVTEPEHTPALVPPPPPPSHPGVDHASMLKDSRIAYWAEVARQKHQENLQRYKMFLLSLPESEREEYRDL